MIVLHALRWGMGTVRFSIRGAPEQFLNQCARNGISLWNIEKKETNDDERIFYWKMDQLPEKYNYYRVEDAEGNKRAMDDVPSHEIINAIIEVLEEQISIGDKTLVREVAKKFGYSRLGNVIENSIKFAIEYGINTEILIKMENGNLKLNENKIASKFSND